MTLFIQNIVPTRLPLCHALSWSAMHLWAVYLILSILIILSSLEPFISTLWRVVYTWPKFLKVCYNILYFEVFCLTSTSYLPFSTQSFSHTSQKHSPTSKVTQFHTAIPRCSSCWLSLTVRCTDSVDTVNNPAPTVTFVLSRRRHSTAARFLTALTDLDK